VSSEVLEMLIVPQLVKKFFTVHVTQRFINIPYIYELFGKPVTVGAGTGSKLCKQQCDIQEF
jgi:ribosomal protein S19